MATVAGAPTAADSALFQEIAAAWERGEAETLLPKLEQALPGTSDYRLWHIHGLILRQMERHGDALHSLERAAELAPNGANPAHALARTRFEAGLPSVDAYARAAQLNRGNTEVLLGLGDLTLVFRTKGADRGAAIVALHRLPLTLGDDRQ